MKRIMRLPALLLAVMLLTGMLLGGNTAMAEFVNTEWYQDMLKSAQLSQGSNLRLKKLIARAQAGETVTVATIGGSITEGAGASNYAECWASRFALRFANTFGLNGQNTVHFVNAGVGGTPSPFGYMRYEKEIVRRVDDADGLPDLVVIEFAVNDWQEPTGHRCYESMVKEILSRPNEPVVILLFSVFRNAFTLQDELKKIGETYDLMMVSMRDSAFPHVGKEWTAEEFFADEYHPTSLGHRVMADCLMRAVEDAVAAEDSPADVKLDAEPAYGTDFMGLTTLFAGEETGAYTVERGSFTGDDYQAYRNHPVGRVCGSNYFHDVWDKEEPLRISGTFRKCLVSWKASAEAQFGAAEVLVDGKPVCTLKGGDGKWGQSEVALVLDEQEAAPHTVEIRVTEERKKFTVTAVSVVP